MACELSCEELAWLVAKKVFLMQILAGIIILILFFIMAWILSGRIMKKMVRDMFRF